MVSILFTSTNKGIYQIFHPLSFPNTLEKKKQVIRVKKLVGLPHSNYLHVFFRFGRAFAEVITFVGASAHEF